MQQRLLDMHAQHYCLPAPCQGRVFDTEGLRTCRGPQLELDLRPLPQADAVQRRLSGQHNASVQQAFQTDHLSQTIPMISRQMLCFFLEVPLHYGADLRPERMQNVRRFVERT